MKSVHRVLDPQAPPPIPRGLCALAVMTKAPRAGKVKTRLSPPLTPQEAAALNICFLRDTSAAISAAATAGGARGIGVYTPVGEEAAYSGILPPDFDLILQRGEAFGERLISATEDLLQVGFHSVCLIDSDSPTVPQHAYAAAVTFLAEGDERVVLGPSNDGGYYLIGMSRLNRKLFENIEWSTERVAEQTLAQAKQLGLEVKLLPTWYDVDDRTTLRRLCAELVGSTAPPSRGFEATHTRAFLTDVITREGRERIWPNE
ncbi:MAG: TIGR04282 family arsenosugar biosynthesis glycosyltransferase [Chthoniobacterales bacterium]